MTQGEEYTLAVHHETERAWIVSETGKDDAETIALPKSLVETDEKNWRNGKGIAYPIYKFTIPDWLAEREGLA
jgi:hypothetical protein